MQCNDVFLRIRNYQWEQHIIERCVMEWGNCMNNEQRRENETNTHMKNVRLYHCRLRPSPPLHIQRTCTCACVCVFALTYACTISLHYMHMCVRACVCIRVCSQRPCALHDQVVVKNGGARKAKSMHPQKHK